MMQTNPHACGVDDTACPSTPIKAHACGVDDGPLHLIPVPSPVLSVGHFSRALLGHSCQAPKLDALQRVSPFLRQESMVRTHCTRYFTTRAYFRVSGCQIFECKILTVRV